MEKVEFKGLKEFAEIPEILKPEFNDLLVAKLGYPNLCFPTKVLGVYRKSDSRPFILIVKLNLVRNSKSKKFELSATVYRYDVDELFYEVKNDCIVLIGEKDGTMIFRLADFAILDSIDNPPFDVVDEYLFSLWKKEVEHLKRVYNLLLGVSGHIYR